MSALRKSLLALTKKVIAFEAKRLKNGAYAGQEKEADAILVMAQGVVDKVSKSTDEA